MITKRIFRLLLFVLCISDKTVVLAQTTVADSLYLNSLFGDNMYSDHYTFPGRWYLNDSFKSNQPITLFQKIDSNFVFDQADFIDCYNNLTLHSNTIIKDTIVNPTLTSYFQQNPNYAFKQVDPVYSLPFSIGTKQAVSYFTFTPKTTSLGGPKIAFLIIPGSDNNQTTQILRGTGYHNANCAVRNKLASMGDLYVYTKPYEDFRGLYRNRKKINTSDYFTPGAKSFLYDYLLINNKSYGVNYLIEAIALTKHLRSKYDKVFLLGCSQGGYATLLATLNMNVDAAVVSCGYSVRFDTSPSDIYALQQNFGGLAQQYADSIVRAKITNSKTNFLFTWANFDTPIYQAERDSNFTQKYFGPLPNVSYFYNYNGHSFPPCNTLDTFINRIVKLPKAFLTTTDTICTTDSIRAKVRLLGKKPMSFDVMYNGSVLQSFVNVTADTMSLYFYNSGEYVISNVKDSLGIKGMSSDVLPFQKHVKPSFVVDTTIFDCHTGYTSIVTTSVFNSGAKLTTISPLGIDTFTLRAIDTIISTSNSISFTKLYDLKGCDLPLNLSYSTDTTRLSCTVSVPKYNCATNLNRVELYCFGLKPYTLVRSVNNIFDTLTFSTDTLTLDLPNGLYNFVSISDAHRCILPIQKVFSFVDSPIKINSWYNQINCSNQNLDVTINANGKLPLTIAYDQDGTQLYNAFSTNAFTLPLSTGTYSLQAMTDANGCSVQLDSIVHNNLKPLNVLVEESIYDCDSLRQPVSITTSGNMPVVINYSANGILSTFQIHDSITWVSLDSGYYFLNNAIDSNGCALLLNQYLDVQTKKIYVQSVQKNYDCQTYGYEVQYNLDGVAPFYFRSTINGIEHVDTFTIDKCEIIVPNSLFILDSITDGNGCTIVINDTLNKPHDSFNVTLAKSSYLCDSNKHQVMIISQGAKPCVLSYFYNGYNQLVSTENDTINLMLDAGAYVFDGVTNLFGCFEPFNYTLNVDTTRLAFSVSRPEVICGDSLGSVEITTSGSYPLSLTYTDQLGLHTLTINSGKHILNVQPNLTTYQLLTASTGCSMPLSDSTTFQYQPIIADVQLAAFDCSNNVQRISFSNGIALPYTYYYTKNGMYDSLVFNSLSDTVDFGDGTYQFISVKDTNMCQQQVTEYFDLNIIPLAVNFSLPRVDCNLGKEVIDLTVQSSDSVKVYYTYNGIPQIINVAPGITSIVLENGMYIFDYVSDINLCSLALGDTIIANYTPVSALVVGQVYNCTTNVQEVNIAVTGWQPLCLTYSANNLLDSICYNVDTFTFVCFGGNTYLNGVRDAAGCTASLNQLISVNATPMTAQLGTPLYNLTLQVNQVPFQCTGQPPFVVLFDSLGITTQQFFNTNNFNLNLPNGSYHINLVYDARGCTTLIDKALSLFYTSPGFQLTNLGYDCITDATKVRMDFSGTFPQKLFINYNNQLQQWNITVPSIDTHLADGNYTILYIQDTSYNQVAINQVLSLQTDPISFHIQDAVFNCNTVNYTLPMVFVGNEPFTLYYRVDGAPMQFTTFNDLDSLHNLNAVVYLDSLVDASSCKQVISTVLDLRYDTFNVTTHLQQRICSEQGQRLHVNFYGGIAPYKISITKDGLTSIITTYANSIDTLLTSGHYYVNYATDTFTCDYSLGQKYVVDIADIAASVGQVYYDCDSATNRMQIFVTGLQPLTLNYTYNSVAASRLMISGNNILKLPDGNYQLTSITDSNGCIFALNNNFTTQSAVFSSQISSPIFNCDSNKYELDIALQGKPPYSFSAVLPGLSFNSLQLLGDTSLFMQSGHLFISSVSDSFGCVKNILSTYLLPANIAPVVTFDTIIYGCQSPINQVIYNVNAVGSYTISCFNLITGNNQVVVGSQPKAIFQLTNGHYVITKIATSTCTVNINDTIIVSNMPLQCSITNRKVNCNIGKYEIDIAISSGTPPFALLYNDGIPKVDSIYQATTKTYKLSQTGTHFSSMIDHHGCVQSLDSILTSDYLPVIANYVSSIPICNTDSGTITINLLQGKPESISFNRPNGNIISLWQVGNVFKVPSGEYSSFEINDTAGCTYNYNQPLNVPAAVVATFGDTVLINCETKQAGVFAEVKGYNPKYLYMLANDAFDSVSISVGRNIIELEAGKYFLMFIKDSFGCISTIYKPFYVPRFFTDTFFITKNGAQLSANINTFPINWYLNDKKIDNETTANIYIRTNAKYYATIIDSNGCEIKSNVIEINYPGELNVFPNPFSSNIYVVLQNAVIYNYSLYDVYGKKLMQGTARSGDELTLDYLAKGAYMLRLEYEDTSKQKIFSTHKLIKQ